MIFMLRNPFNGQSLLLINMPLGLNKYFRRLKNHKPEEIYDFKSYWTKEGEQYFNNYSNMSKDIMIRYETQADLIVKFLADLEFNSVCEAGCGFGRITKRILDRFEISKENYLAFDLSPDQIHKASELVGDRAEVRNCSIEEMDASRQFDLVLASEVLMHIPHEHIKNNIIKLVDLSSKYIVNIDWKETDSKKSSFCNFAHDYAKIYKQLGLRVQSFDLDKIAPDLTHRINQTLYLAIK